MRLGFVVTVLVSAFLILQFVDQQASARPHTVKRIKHQPMDDIGFERSEALHRLNMAREATGMPPFAENSKLSKAAQAHADYLVLNRANSHFEDRAKKGFTGEAPMQRAIKAGYKSRFTGENLSTKSKNAADSIGGLFSAIYHRFGFLNPLFDEIGIGITQDKDHPENSAFVYLMGNSDMNRLCRGRNYNGKGSYVLKACADPKHKIAARVYKSTRKSSRALSPKIIIYPYDGQKEVPPAFYDETPDPLPEHDVSGFPVSVEFNLPKHRDVKLISFRLFEKNGDEIKSAKILDHSSDPHHKLTKYQFALMPLKRLKYSTAYTAKIKYAIAGKQKILTWSFTTITPPEKLEIIRDKDTKLTLKAGKSYWLYFEPQNPHDVLGTMQFPEDVYVRFVDNNTMRVVIDIDRSRDFDIKGSGRVVHIEVN